MIEFSVEELLGDAIVRHTGDVTCPSQLGLVRDGGDAGEVCPLQNLCIGDLVVLLSFPAKRSLSPPSSSPDF